MPLRVKLDENLGRTHLAFLRNAGYDAESVHDEGLSGSDDSTLWEHICKEGRLLVTLDTDFADVRRFPLGTHPGILLLRSKSHGRPLVLEILTRDIAERAIDHIQGCLAVADETHTRIRTPFA
jgi:predicted nuclease of predicted toxin-antitoxin system